MKFIPILYSTPMVQGVLDNRKDRTRRTKGLELINDRPNEFIRLDGYHQDDIPRPARKYDDRFYYAFTGKRSNMVTTVVHCPYGKPGDILWVREKTCYVHLEHAHDLLEGFREKRQTIYGTDMHEDWMKYAKEKYGYKWKPSLFMPKSDCRIFLKVKSVRVERLQDISREDAINEGVEFKQFKNQGLGYRVYGCGTENQEVKRLCSVSITETQGAQMWAVKAITWKD